MNHSDFIPLLRPDLPTATELLPWLEQIDQRRWYTNFGPLAQLLEQRLCALLEDNGAVFARPLHVASSSSGTSALELGLHCLNLPPGAKVLLPALTFPATGTAVRYAGLTPVLSDVESDTWLLTPAIARRVLQHSDIDLVMPVASFGYPQDASAWDRFTEETGIPVLIDAAAGLANQTVGLHSKIAFSLHATKAFGIGEGGLLAARDENFIQRFKTLSNFGFADGLIARAGTNAKLSEYHAAVGLAQWQRWPQMKRQRQQLRRHYERLFQRYGLIERLQTQGDAERHLHNILPLCLPPGDKIEALMGFLQQSGIETRRWYCPPLSRQPAFANCERLNPWAEGAAAALPVTEQLAARLLGVPFYPGLSHTQIERICAQLAKGLEIYYD